MSAPSSDAGGDGFEIGIFHFLAREWRVGAGEAVVGAALVAALVVGAGVVEAGRHHHSKMLNPR